LHWLPAFPRKFQLLCISGWLRVSFCPSWDPQLECFVGWHWSSM
jgi:hypothetical protein